MKNIWVAFVGLLLILSSSVAYLPAAANERFLTVTVNGMDCRLGATTAQEIAADGWPYVIEWDGTYSFYSAENESYFFVKTQNGAVSGPIVYIDLMWADGIPVSYCGFQADGENNDGISLWDWLIDSFQAEMNEDGTLIAQVPLSEGRILQIATKDVRVRLSLIQ